MNLVLSIGIALLWWVAYVLLIKFKFTPAVGRAFLVGGLLAATAPFFNIWPSWSTVQLPSIHLPEVSIAPVPETNSPGSPWLAISVLQIVLVVTGFLVVRFLWIWTSAFRLAQRFKQSAEPDQRGFYRIHAHQPAFTFGWWIFLPHHLESEEEALILAHEKAHVSCRHYLDRWLGELLRCAFWWNPFSHLLLSELYVVHEHQADYLAHSGRTREYAALLLKQVLTPAHRQFNLAFFPSHANLKSRIAMMTKTKPFKSTKIALLATASVSLTSFLLLAACNKPEQLEVEEAPQVLNIMELDRVPGFKACAGTSDSAAFICFSTEMAAHIAQTFKYPEQAREAKAQGRVFVEFVLDETGDVAEVTIKRSGRTEQDSPEMSAAWDALEAEVIGTINALPELEPAQKDGKAVRVRYVVPINCQIS